MKRAAFMVLAGLLLSGAAAAAPAAPKAPADDEKEGTITGLAIPRNQGGYIGVEIVGGSFKITFYNEKKKPVAADRSSAVLRWPVHYQPNNEHTELLATADPAVLSNSYPVRAPYAFHKLHIVLMNDGGADAESYDVDYPAPA
jgi:hypothetical protein